MSKELDVVLKATALLSAINEDDLTTTIELVNWLNENFEPTEIEGIPDLNIIIPLGNLIKYFTLDNKSLDFVVNNLQNYDSYGGMSRIKWGLTVKTVLMRNNYEEMVNLVENHLNNGLLEDYQIASIITLCTNMNRYDLLNMLYAQIPNVLK